MIAFTSAPLYALRWAPYLAWLPTALPRLPMFWPLESLERLAGAAAADKLVDAQPFENQSIFVEPPAQARLSTTDQSNRITTEILMRFTLNVKMEILVMFKTVIFAQTIRL